MDRDVTTLDAWHFLRADGRLNYPPHTQVEAGQTLTVDPPIALCQHGLHASRRAVDALSYAPGPIVCRVRLGGTIIHDDDKLVATERTVLWIADATTTLHELACWAAEAALFGQAMRGHVIDARSLAAIDTKRRWLRGQASDSELHAAWDAAGAAAWDAARAAAGDAARAATNTELTRRLMLLAPV